MKRSFWQRKGILNFLLLPLGSLYYLGHLINYHVLQKPKSVSSKVICIGNATLGGNGKTPYAIYLAKQLLLSGEKVAFISRGYGGKLSSRRSVHRVNSQYDSCKDVGDEPLLLAKIAPTYICKNRYLSAKKAQLDGATTLIMDDGLQNNTLKADEKIMLYDANSGFGNGFLFPSGPMREPFKQIKKRINKIIVIGANDPTKVQTLLKYKNIEFMEPCIENIDGISKKCSLLTAIANSHRIISLLEKSKIRVLKHTALRDHSHFSQKVLNEAVLHARNNNCMLLTTTKDFTRIPKRYRKDFTQLIYSLKPKKIS